jgi:TRAP-type mannitol/chloroaromatic compound transport system substrate-binding protein
MSEKVTAASGGRLVMKCNPADAIVPATKEFDGVDSGAIDYAMTAYGYWTDKFPAAQLFTYQVGGLSPMEAAAWQLIGGGNELAMEMITGYNVKLLTGVILPPEIFLWTHKELKSPADMKGLKYRSGGGDEPTIFGEYLGTAGVFMPTGEIYESMQRNVIDGFQCSSPGTDYSLGFQEVAEYCWLSPIRQPSEFHSYLFNTESWAALPDDLKVLVEEMCLATGLENYTYMMVEDVKALAKIKEYGTNVLPVPKSIEDAILAATADYYAKKKAEDPFMAKVLDSVDAFKATYREAYQRL